MCHTLYINISSQFKKQVPENIIMKLRLYLLSTPFMNLENFGYFLLLSKEVKKNKKGSLVRRAGVLQFQVNNCEAIKKNTTNKIFNY